MDAQLDGGLASPRQGAGRIFIVDGASEWRQFVGNVMAEASFDIVACESGAKARARFETDRPDLVLLGIELVDTTAVSLCRWIRLRSDVPIVVVNERDTLGEVSLLEVGADLVLRAPIGRLELVARVRAALRRTPPRDRANDEVVAFGGMKLNRVDGLLEVEATTIRLEGRSLTLMDMLLRHGGNVTPRRNLQEALSIGDSELDGHVRRLREHLEPVEQWRRIVTVRGVGFRLLEDRSEIELDVDTPVPPAAPDVAPADCQVIGADRG